MTILQQFDYSKVKDYQMEGYDLDDGQVIAWAMNYASYEELERVAKAIYGIYVQRRKQERPQSHQENRKLRKQYH
jgi:hypothetical protein